MLYGLKDAPTTPRLPICEGVALLPVPSAVPRHSRLFMSSILDAPPPPTGGMEGLLLELVRFPHDPRTTTSYTIPTGVVYDAATGRPLITKMPPPTASKKRPSISDAALGCAILPWETLLAAESYWPRKARKAVGFEASLTTTRTHDLRRGQK